MTTLSSKDELKIGICLSGGGVRALLYHLGVLKGLAEQGLLSNIVGISSVSGGSVLMGLIYHYNGLKFPTDQEYIDNVYPKIFKLVTTTNIQNRYASRFVVNPINIKNIGSAANVLSKTIQSGLFGWGVKDNFTDIAEEPVWSVNGTTLQTGKRFRFKTSKVSTMGDWKTDYSSVDELKLADVMAVSAAFPGGVGPLKISTADYEWHNYKTPGTPTTPPFETLNIIDGGVYDNLGLEAFLDISKQRIKSKWSDKMNYLIVADASPEISESNWQWWRVFKRSMRMIDIMMDQIRNLRVRTFVGYLIANPNSGLYLPISSSAVEMVNKVPEGERKRYKKLIDKSLFPWKAERAANYPTDFKKAKHTMAEELVRHGRESLCNSMEIYLSFPDENKE